jgi:1-acyl-sn-glycerol-3-phosphate acyltransferase
VDRKSKDRRVLLGGTLEALSKGYAVALFPEGTSYTEPRIMQIKDGAAWAALEYAKLRQESPEKNLQPLSVVPAAIVYTNKTKYRSNVRISCLPFPSLSNIPSLGRRRVCGPAIWRKLCLKLITAQIWSANNNGFVH